MQLKLKFFRRENRSLRSRKGSFTVFAVMLFTAVLAAVTAAISGALSVSNIGAVNSLGKLWGKNILAEYDLFLKDRYGIFGFYGNDYVAEDKLKFYSDYSFSEKKHIDISIIKADAESYSLDKPVMLKKQIKDAVLYGSKPRSYSLSTDRTQADLPEEKTRSIESPWIKENLPSYGKTDKLYISELADKVRYGLSPDKATSQMAEDKYIFSFFKDIMNERNLGETYFRAEIEYIISGKLSDNAAQRDVKSKIKTLRNILNLYYLYTCPEKRQAVLAIAKTVTPGPAAFLTQAVMMETWAYMEAENDINILYNHKTVPLLKKDCNWALTLENVFNTEGEVIEGQDSEQALVLPEVIEGEDYESYLKVLILGLTEETKLLRISDLIQINGKYLYCGSFLLKDYCSGLKYIIKTEGQEREFEEYY